MIAPRREGKPRATGRERLELGRAARVDRRCDRFESDWRAGRSPKIEALLATVNPDDRPELLRELVMLEVELRSGRGESPTAADYEQRFPPFATLIRSVFEETRSERSPAVEAPSPASARPAIQPPPTTDPGADPDLTTVMGGGAPQSAPTPATAWIGKYRLVGELGRGGMGVVYKAWQPDACRFVALKVMREPLGAQVDPPILQAFLMEARTAAGLEHEHIVPLYDVGFDGEERRPFLVFRVIDGPTLAALVRNDGPMAPKRAAGFVRDAARAVAHAHDRGVLHRDLKPSNILIDSGGRVFVADFGLAKRLADAGSGSTEPGKFKGTLAYTAPEQARGAADLGVGVDVYGLGATLYELITGRPPFQSADPAATLRQVVEDDPVAPRRLAAGVPRDLETIAQACLEKSPAARYPSAQALVDELDRFLDGRPIRRRPLGPIGRAARLARRRPVATAALAVAAVALLAFGALGITTWADRRAMATTMVLRLQEVPVADVPRLAQVFGAARNGAAPRLKALLAERPGDRVLATKVALALVAAEAEPWAEILADRLADPDVGPDDHRAIRNALAEAGLDRAAGDRLWPIAADSALESPRRVRASAAILALEAPAGLAGRMLGAGPDNTDRTAIIDWLVDSRADPARLATRLATEPDPSIRRALCQALARPPAERPGESVVDLVERLYRDDPDPGVHGSAGYALRSWGLGDRARRVDADLAGKPRGLKDWFVTDWGQTFVVVRPPAPARPFAIAATETTVAEYRRVGLEPPPPRDLGGMPIGDFVHDPAGPVTRVSYRDAVAYCDHLTLQAGTDSAATLAWRLPARAEWEYAARAGTATTYYHGRSPAALGRYAWCLVGSREDDPRSPGLLRPNDLGLFDTLGNAGEWATDPPGVPAALVDGEPCDDYPAQPVMGGSFIHQPQQLRAGPVAGPGGVYPEEWSTFFIGFRIAATLDD